MTFAPRVRVRVRVLALALSAALALTLGLAGCAPSASPIPTPTSGAAIPADYAKFYQQQLAWTSCGSGDQCTTASAPLDWAAPAGPTISLALVRHLATGGTRLGSLFVNPGGPGASGVDFVKQSLNYAVSSQVQGAYDVIGFDPRGIGASTAVRCFDTAAELDHFIFDLNAQPRASAAWLDSRAADSANFAAACAKKSGDLLAHVDTVSAAKDLDMLRAVVGDSVLNYLGYSYGTLLGATYADLFPTRVGRMVLDGALDPASSNTDVLVNQARGFENALRNYLSWCLQQKQCPFAQGGAGHPGTAPATAEVDGAMTIVGKLLDALETSPLTGKDGRKVGADTMLTAIIAPLYSKSQWPALTQVFQAVAGGSADAALASADSYYNRVNGVYQDNSTEAFSAVNCLDYPVSADRAQWAKDAATLAVAAPIMGPYLSYGDAVCAAWPTKSIRTPAPVTAVGSPDILVVGTTGDPATPYQWAVNLAGELPHGHLITYTGEGHTAYNKSNSCVNNAVDDFFLSGKVPAVDPRC
jgi:pimeloyl-ACP methyl ester carboxylesterase